MDRESLLERRTELSNKFDELEKQKKQIEIEQFKLQGEFRLVNELFNSLDTRPEEDRVKSVLEEQLAEPPKRRKRRVSPFAKENK